MTEIFKTFSKTLQCVRPISGINKTREMYVKFSSQLPSVVTYHTCRKLKLQFPVKDVVCLNKTDKSGVSS